MCMPDLYFKRMRIGNPFYLWVVKLLIYIFFSPGISRQHLQRRDINNKLTCSWGYWPAGVELAFTFTFGGARMLRITQVLGAKMLTENCAYNPTRKGGVKSRIQGRTEVAGVGVSYPYLCRNYR